MENTTPAETIAKNTSPATLCRGDESIHAEAPNIKLILQAPKIGGVNHTLKLAKWYLIYTRSNFEKKIHTALVNSGFEAFLPLVKVRRQWSDRIKTMCLPLLPNYVFIKTTYGQFREVYILPGFVRFVAFEEKPCEVREEEISLLEKIVSHGLVAQSSTFCKVEKGDLVKVVRGPLSGWKGKVESIRGKTHIVFNLDYIRQAVSVVVSAGDVERVG